MKKKEDTAAFSPLQLQLEEGVEIVRCACDLPTNMAAPGRLGHHDRGHTEHNYCIGIVRVVYKASYSRYSRSRRMRHRQRQRGQCASRVCGFVSSFHTSPMPALVTGKLICAG